MFRLKKNNVDSMGNKDDELQNALGKSTQDKDTNKNDVSSSDIEDDSILHFKSPKLIPNRFTCTVKSTVLAKRSKLKSGNERIKSSVMRTRKNSSEQLREARPNLDNVQSRTESSFFQPGSSLKFTEKQSAESSHACPLCLKVLRDENTKVIHMKSCASTHNISTKKLLDALSLQERQAEERKSLGLFAAPILRVKKKRISRKFNVQDDHDLQYALALSKSLQESEEAMESTDSEFLMSIYGSKETVRDDRGPLSRFGFTSNKPITEDPTDKSRKRKILKETVLQTRSKEERDTLMGERVAEILMGSDAVTQRSNEESQSQQGKEKATVLRSHFLKELVQSENKLWDKTSLIKHQSDFYVKTIVLQGCTNTKRKPETETDIAMTCLDENGQYCPLDAINGDLRQNCNVDESLEKYYDSPVTAEKQSDGMEVERASALGLEKNFVNNLVMDWRNALNDSSMSDIAVLLNDDKRIWTHKLVLYVRCSNLLLDVESTSDSRYPVGETISWPDVDYFVGLAFLEFIYCGTIEKYSDVLNDEEKLINLRRLTRRYRVKDLFAYLRSKGKIDTFERKEKERSFHSNPPRIIEISDKSLLEESTNEGSKDRLEYSVSPDIFDDTANVALNFSQSRSSLCKSRLQVNPKDGKNDTDSNNISSTINNKDERACTVNLSRKGEISAEDFPRIKSNNEDNAASITQTPTTSKSSDSTLTLPKEKNSLILFIEETQRQNAKDELNVDSLSDSSTPEIYRRRINPFKVNRDDSDSSPTYGKTFRTFKKKNVRPRLICSADDLNFNLSAIERIENEHIENVNPALFWMEKTIRSKDVEKSSLNDATNRDIGFHGNMEETSVRRNRRNCIEKEECPIGISSFGRNARENQRNRSRVDSPESNIEEDRTFEDEEESFSNDENVSMYTKYKSKNKNNSIEKYRSAFLDRTRDGLSFRKDACDNEKRPSGRDENMEISKSTIHEEHIETIVLSDTESIESVTESYEASSSKVTSNTPGCDDPVASRYSRAKRKSTECNSRDAAVEAEKEHVRRSPNQRFTKTSSPGSNKLRYDNREIEKNADSLGSLETYQSFDIPEKERTTYYLNHRTNLENRDAEEEEEEEDEDKNWDSEDIVLIDVSEDSAEKSLRVDQSTHANNRKKKDILSYFQRKSLSEVRFNVSPSKTTEPTIVKKGVTPSPNYSSMSSPELCRELKKYGLKAQKRSRAVKLLKYVYDESHPLVPLSPVSTDEIIDSDEEKGALRKKRKHSWDDSKENDDRSNNGGNAVKAAFLQQSCGREVKRDDSGNARQVELRKTGSKTFKKQTDIREAFGRSIKENRELYTKVLRYKGINIQELQSTCKARGVTCSIKTLMDCADKQCVTVRIPNKNNYRNRRESRSKASTSKT